MQCPQANLVCVCVCMGEGAHFLIGGSFFLNDSSFCQVDLKLPRAMTFEYGFFQIPSKFMYAVAPTGISFLFIAERRPIAQTYNAYSFTS